MRDRGLLIAGIMLVLVAIFGLIILSTVNQGWTPGPMGPMMGRPITPSTFRSNGERIYYTATSDSGDLITFTGGPYWLYMHGGSCVNCHGTDGKGGLVVPMTNQVAPDIRYNTLTSETAMEHEHPPYTDALIKRAITEGLDSTGNPLSESMPRWRMSNRDLNDLIGYLKTLSDR